MQTSAIRSGIEFECSVSIRKMKQLVGHGLKGEHG